MTTKAPRSTTATSRALRMVSNMRKGNPMPNPTPSKRSMERAARVKQDILQIHLENKYANTDTFSMELDTIALAFDGLIEECATVADDCKCMELTNDSCKCFGIAKAIRLKLKGGEDGGN